MHVAPKAGCFNLTEWVAFCAIHFWAAWEVGRCLGARLKLDRPVTAIPVLLQRAS